MTNGESWDALVPKYLKADMFGEDEEVDVVCFNYEIQERDMTLNITFKGEDILFSLNMPNKKFLMNNGCAKPKDVIGKRLTLMLVDTQNPETKETVKGIRISKID